MTRILADLGLRQPTEEELARKAGTVDLHDDDGVVFGVAHYRAGPGGDRWYARAKDDASVMSIGQTVDAVTKQLQRKIGEKR